MYFPDLGIKVNDIERLEVSALVALTRRGIELLMQRGKVRDWTTPQDMIYSSVVQRNFDSHYHSQHGFRMAHWTFECSSRAGYRDCVAQSPLNSHWPEYST